MPEDRAFPLDAAETRCLPARFYTDPAVLAAEREALFFRSWRHVCHVSRLESPGAFVTASILDQEVFVVRGHDGALRAFYNVCPHRGHPLVEGEGRKGRIACPYHAWTYDLDGRLFRARGSDDFAACDIALSPVRVDQLLDFVFVNLDPDAASLADTAPGLAEDIAAAVPDLADYRPGEGRDYFGGLYQCNWKVALDNFLECYHCETAHPSFSDMMCIPGTEYRFETGWSCQTIPHSGRAETAAYRFDLDEDALTGYFWFLFPNTTLSVFPGTKNFAISTVLPDGPERCTRTFDVMTPPGVSAEREAARTKWGLEVVNAEDRRLCENVQRGMRSRGFERGWYLVDPGQGNVSEEAVRLFHARYLAALAGSGVA